MEDIKSTVEKSKEKFKNVTSDLTLDKKIAFAIAGVLVIGSLGFGMKNSTIETKISEKITKSLKENQMDKKIVFGEVECSGLITTDCVLKDIRLYPFLDMEHGKDGYLSVRKITVNDVEKFRKIKDVDFNNKEKTYNFLHSQLKSGFDYNVEINGMKFIMTNQVIVDFKAEIKRSIDKIASSDKDRKMLTDFLTSSLLKGGSDLKVSAMSDGKEFEFNLDSKTTYIDNQIDLKLGYDINKFNSLSNKDFYEDITFKKIRLNTDLKDESFYKIIFVSLKENYRTSRKSKKRKLNKALHELTKDRKNFGDYSYDDFTKVMKSENVSKKLQEFKSKISKKFKDGNEEVSDLGIQVVDKVIEIIQKGEGSITLDIRSDLNSAKIKDEVNDYFKTGKMSKKLKSIKININ